jgi:hypothetical protein
LVSALILLLRLLLLRLLVLLLLQLALLLLEACHALVVEAQEGVDHAVGVTCSIAKHSKAQHSTAQRGHGRTWQH